MNTDEKLKKLHELRKLLDNGTLTQEEFEKLKATIVRELAQNEPIADKNKSEFPPEANISNNHTQSKKKNFQNDTTSDYTSKKSSGKEKSKKKKPFYKRVWFIILIIFIVFVCIVLFTPGSDSTSNSKNSPSNVELSEDKAENSNVKSEEKTTEAPVLTSISAKYDGATSAGIVLDSNDPYIVNHIIVTATYDDGSTKQVTNWRIEKAKTLKAQKNTTVVISYRNLSCKLKVFCTSKVKKTATEEKAEFKKSCKEIAYKKIARNPDNYIAKKIKISGKVIQVMEDNDDLTLRVATKDGHDDVFLVAYTYSDNDSKVLEDDSITIWGYCQGTVTYESTLGGNITIPAMSAKYLKISE